MSTQKKYTIYDVAERAGVSPATVSRVINQTASVSGKTVEKVKNAMKELNYSAGENVGDKEPDRGLVIVSVPALTNPFYDDIIGSIKAVLQRAGYSILLITEIFTPKHQKKLESLARMPQVKGFITLSHNHTETLQRIHKIRPVVQCCEINNEIEISSVTIDDFASSVNVMRHLISLGCKKIAIINGPSEYKYARDRFAGYKFSLKEAGLDFFPRFLITAEVNHNSAFSAAMQLLSRPVLPDAVFASSDVFALATVRAAYQNHIQIPGDMMVTGFDNIEFSALTVPSITTVNQPRQQLGFSAAELLLEKIENPEAAVRHLVLNTELIIRESTRHMS